MPSSKAACAVAAAAAGSLLGFVLTYLVTLKRAVVNSNNSVLMRLLGMPICMKLNQRLIFNIYWLVSAEMDFQARAKCQLLAAINRQRPIPPQSTCFIGSSTFTYWQHLERDMAPIPVYNAAFGGSCTPDIMRYLPELVFPYNPRVIVYYCGINDIAAGGTAEQALHGFVAFVDATIAEKKRNPTCALQRIVYLSMIISPYQIMAGNRVEAERGNDLVSQYCLEQNTNNCVFRLEYVNANDNVALQDTNMYINDGLHLNDQGHVELGKILAPFIPKN